MQVSSSNNSGIQNSTRRPFFSSQDRTQIPKDSERERERSPFPHPLGRIPISPGRPVSHSHFPCTCNAVQCDPKHQKDNPHPASQVTMTGTNHPSTGLTLNPHPSQTSLNPSAPLIAAKPVPPHRLQTIRFSGPSSSASLNSSASETSLFSAVRRLTALLALLAREGLRFKKRALRSSSSACAFRARWRSKGSRKRAVSQKKSERPAASTTIPSPSSRRRAMSESGDSVGLGAWGSWSWWLRWLSSVASFFLLCCCNVRLTVS